jgi:hypothetical protein
MARTGFHLFAMGLVFCVLDAGGAASFAGGYIPSFALQLLMLQQSVQ